MRGGLHAVAAFALLASISTGAPPERTPAETTAAVVASAGGGSGARPCPPLVRRSPGSVAGGCVVRIGGELDLTVMTLVGPLRFARCDIDAVLHVDGDGRTALTEIVIIGEQPCNDETPCFDEEHVYPLEGRIVAGAAGSLVHVLDACFDTCMGRFEGELELPLRRSATGWRMDADRAVAGLSGWEVDGTWRIRGDLGLRTAGDVQRREG